MSFIKIDYKNTFNSNMISIARNSKSISFGADFIRENNLKKAKYVCLYIDFVDFIRIGFSFHNEKIDQNCIKLNSYKDIDSKIIIARKFFNECLPVYIKEAEWVDYKKRKYTPQKEINKKYGVIYYIKLQRNDFDRQDFDLDYDEQPD